MVKRKLVDTELLDKVDGFGSDPAISDGTSIEQMLDTRGWKLLLHRLESARQEALYHVMAIGASEGFPASHWRSRLAAFDEVIGIPHDYLKAKEIALKNKEDDLTVQGILNPH